MRIDFRGVLTDTTVDAGRQALRSLQSVDSTCPYMAPLFAWLRDSEASISTLKLSFPYQFENTEPHSFATDYIASLGASLTIYR
jgi:hypothetical protein